MAASSVTLVPQVVDDLPIRWDGGSIFDGRGIAAAFMLGRSASTWGPASSRPEAPIEDAWKAAIASAQSEDAVKVEVLNDIQPLPGTAGYGTVLRSLRTPFMDEWGTKCEEARREGGRLWSEIQARARVGRRHETLLTAGQTSGGIKEILPVAEIIRQLTAEAETALSRGPSLASR
jgi:NAD(P)H-dependent flavin oxidoreductase YrpB (nitropropane dioxygenase family)